MDLKFNGGKYVLAVGGESSAASQRMTGVLLDNNVKCSFRKWEMWKNHFGD